MKRVLLVLLFAAGLVSCSEDGPVPVIDAGPPAPVKVTVARLSELRGKVTLTRDGATTAATAGALYEGDEVETGEDGHALLSNGAREIELLESSRFRVGKTLGELALARGELLIEDLDGGESTGVAGAFRTRGGASVSLVMRDGGTSISVRRGALEIEELEDGGVSAFGEGQRLTVRRGSLEIEELEAPKPPPAPTATSVKLVPRGSVTLKPKSGPSAKVPAAGTELSEPGTFTIDKGSGLRAEAGGAVAELDPGSKGSLEPGTGDPRLGVTLTAGGMRVFLKAGESVLLGGRKSLRVRAKTASTLVVTSTKEGPRVEVLGGETEVTAGNDLPRLVKSGESVVPKGKGLDGSKRVPVLTMPAGRNTRVYWARPGDVTLAFPPGEGPMEVSTDPQFGTLLVSAEGGDSLLVPAPLKGSLFWRRKGDPESASARFERDEAATAVAAKSDTVAETGLKATVIFQGAVPTLTFTFPPKDGAASWHFRVYAKDDLKTPLVDRRLTENRAVVDSGTLKEGSYVWSAIAMDRAGAEQPGGRMNKMDIVFDNSVTRLVLTSPREGERASNAVGLAPLGSRLTLNGKAVSLDAAGRFSVPTGGASLLVFRLVTRDGAESQWVRRVAK